MHKQLENDIKEETSKSIKKKRENAPSKNIVASNVTQDCNNAPMPHDIKPMLATLTDKAFNHKDWIFEIKWDGFRALAEIEDGGVKLYSRNLLSFAADYPSIVESLKKIPQNAVIDGEIVALNEEGLPSFQLLQNRKNSPNSNLHYYAYDILYADGCDLQNKPLIERKRILQQLLPNLDNISYSDHVEETGEAFFKQAQTMNLEGIMAKDANSPYRIGKRSTEWLKIKTSRRQEAVIAGYTEPRGSRKLFGALVLGIYEGGEFKYIGHSGGGFNQDSLKAIYEKLKARVTDKSPFKTKVLTNMPVTWVKPELVCEISFSEWTNEGIMRHPIYQGLRNDKDAKEVIKENEQNTTSVIKKGE